MKIISSATMNNIRITCRCCDCVYEIESKDDFNILYVYKPTENGFVDYSVKIPEYFVACPDCGAEAYIGLDPHDTEYTIPNAICYAITNRSDWKERYSVEAIRKGMHNYDRQ